jgi:hypothetical protein
MPHAREHAGRRAVRSTAPASAPARALDPAVPGRGDDAAAPAVPRLRLEWLPLLVVGPSGPSSPIRRRRDEAPFAAADAPAA